MNKMSFFLLLFIFSCYNPTESDSENIDCLGIMGGNAVEDCAGICNGGAVEDECGVCNGDGIVEGACDCEGNADDECGVCGGNGMNANDYGTCNCEIDGDVFADCTGICDGLNTIDNCGTCDATPTNDCFVDNYEIGHVIHMEHQALEFEYCYPLEISGNTFSFASNSTKVFMLEMSASW